MRTTRLSAAVAATVALATLGLANTVAAADTVGFEYDVSCDGGGYIDINIDINADDPNDRFLIELDGVTLDSDVPPGDSQFLNQGPFDDGMVQLWVKTDPGAQVVFGWEIPVTCDGPIVEIESQCNDDNDGQFINVGLWDSDTQTFNVWVAGVLVGNGVESNDTSGYLGYGSYPLGEIQVDVDWLENPDDNPYVSVPCQHHFSTRSSHEIFALVFGKGVPQGKVVDRTVSQAQIASTVGRLMGMKTPFAENAVLEEVFA